jgi:hypothetical protein
MPHLETRRNPHSYTFLNIEKQKYQGYIREVLKINQKQKANTSWLAKNNKKNTLHQWKHSNYQPVLFCYSSTTWTKTLLLHAFVSFLPYLFVYLMVLGIKPRASYVLGKYSYHWVTYPDTYFFQNYLLHFKTIFSLVKEYCWNVVYQNKKYSR